MSRQLDKHLCWDSFAEMKGSQTMLNYINNTVLRDGLAKQYNHSDDIFQEKLKIRNPYTVKEIVDKLSELKLLNTESEIKGDAFEYFLKSLASGNDLGEYFTPRQIVKLMVNLTNPRFGNTVFDPFCGTGGFLIEAFRHIKKGVDENDKKIMNVLREQSIFGIELTDTYKIAKMNMIITGDGHNNIVQDDTAKNKYWENQDLRKLFSRLSIKGFDIVLSNIPYGQTTDYGNLYSVPSHQGDSIFVQHLLMALNKGGTCGVIVPEGFLFKREHLKTREYVLKESEVESIISLPSGVFLPYTNVKTSIIIFKKGKPTKKVWFYDVENDGFELTTNRRKINKNDLPDLISKWIEKPTSEKSFWIDIDKIKKNDFALNLSKYKIKEVERESKYPLKSIGEVCSEIKSGGTPSRSRNDYYHGDINWVNITDMKSQFISETKNHLTKKGLENSSAKILPKETVLISIFAALGEVAILDKEATTNQAIAGLIPKKEIDNKFMYYILKSRKAYLESLGRGVAQKNINLSILKKIEIPVPPLNIQKEIVKELDKQMNIKESSERIVDSIEEAGINESFFNSKKQIKLIDVTEINPRYKSTEKSNEYFLEMAGIDELTGKIKYFKKKTSNSSGFSKFREDDIIFARITPCAENGKVAISKGLNEEVGLGSTEFIILSPKKVNPKWLYFLLKTKKVKEGAISQMTGTTGRQRIPKSYFEKLLIPEVGLDEQIKLVNELEYYINTKEDLLKVIRLSEKAIENTINSLYN